MRIIVFILFIFLQVSAIGQGLVFDHSAYQKGHAKPQIMRGNDVLLPSKSSLKQYAPRPGNQLDYASSVGWAIGWAGKTILYAKHKNLQGNAILPHIFAPAYINQMANPDDHNCSEGTTLENGLITIKKYGVPKLNDFLYFCEGPVTKEIKEKAKEHRISDYAKLFNLHDAPEDKINAVKMSISEGYPVVVGMKATPSFKRAKEFWQPTEAPDSDHPGHAVCIVGYDDSKYGGSFEIMNSWGKNWGNGGFMWIRYKDFNDYIKYAYEMFELPGEDAEIAGSLDFKMSTGDPMDVEMVEAGYYKMIKSYKEGDNFRVYINNDDPAFLYVFGSDLTNSFFPLFPVGNNVSAALNYKASSIAIPGADSYIQFDNTAGTDFLCVLYSREELDFEGIIKDLESVHGTFSQKIHTVLDAYLLNKNMKWSPDHVKFTGDAKKGNVVAVVVEISHN